MDTPPVIYLCRCVGPRGCGQVFTRIQGGMDTGTMRCPGRAHDGGCDSGCFAVCAYYPDVARRITTLETRMRELRVALLSASRLPRARAAMERMWDRWADEDVGQMSARLRTRSVTDETRG